MRRFRIAPVLLILATSAAATEERFLVRADSSLERLEELSKRLGFRFVKSQRETEGESVAVVSSSLPRDVARALLEAEESVRDVESVQLFRMGDSRNDNARDEAFDLLSKHAARAASRDLVENRRVDYHGIGAAPVYTDQPAVSGLGLKRLHRYFGIGKGVVAVIDTGVDPRHPLLRSALVEGYDFLADEPGIPSEFADLDPETAAALDQSTVAVLESRELAILNQSTVAVLEKKATARISSSEYQAFGHGTMVAGLVRLVAPGARIMPLKAFRADGTAETADVAAAVYYAVDHGADVINMSFSFEVFSPEVMRALNYATRSGVIAIAAAGNTGEPLLVFPASLANVVGVAATDLRGELSSISNHGADVVKIGAPGEELVSSYPGGAYAMGFGTSFSAALVSGAAAVLHTVAPGEPAQRIEEALALGRKGNGRLGYGGLDIFGSARWLVGQRETWK